MFRRIWDRWERARRAAEGADAHLSRITQLLEVSEARLAQMNEALAAAEARQSASLEFAQAQLNKLNIMEVHLGRVEHMLALSHPRFASPLRLEPHGAQVFSQNDEDGIIAEIFRRIGASARTFIEIAAGNGRENCSAFLLSQGWRGLWVECEDANVRSIRERWPKEISTGQLKISPEFVTRESANKIVANAALGDEIDILIMDIDGNDYHILEALEVRPRVICAEYYARKSPPVHWVMPYEEEHKVHPCTPGVEVGASLQAFDNLLTPRGYSLVGTSIAGINCFFVRSDLVDGKFEAPFTSFNHYNPARYWYFTHNFMSQIWTKPLVS